jgi:hypothetical protein
MSEMSPLLIALGWMFAAEAIWAAALILAAIFFVPKSWLAETFLDPMYLSQSSQVIESSTNDMVAAFVDAGLTIFGASVICCVIWHVCAAVVQINGPGQAARFWLLWLLVLIVGWLAALGGSYYYVGLSRFVPNNAMYEFYGAATILFVLSYYIGTVFSTTRKLRPAVPFARLLPA